MNNLNTIFSHEADMDFFVKLCHKKVQKNTYLLCDHFSLTEMRFRHAIFKV